MLVWRLSKANLKKKRGVSLTFILFIFLATLMLDMGLSLISKIDSFYDEKETEFNSPQFYAMVQNNEYKTEYEEYVLNDERIQLAEKENVVYMTSTKNNKNTLEFAAVIFDKDKDRKIAPFLLAEEDTSVDSDEAIYLPLIMKSYNVKLGDDFEIIYKGTTFSFKVGGFFETTYMGVVDGGILKYFVSNEVYNKIYEKVGGATFISARFKATPKEAERISERFVKDFTEATNFYGEGSGIFATYNCLGKYTVKTQVVSIMSVPSMIYIVVAFVISIVVLFIIFFKVVESIEENTQNIGSLQAIGYTTKQIRGSIVLEFLSLSLVGSILGILGSYVANYLTKDTLSATSGLKWIYSLHLIEDIICLTLMISVVIGSSYLGSARIKRLPPVTALRNGTKAHAFRKNYFPLSKGIGGVHSRLALKNVMTYLKQNLILLFIILGGTFAIGLTAVMYMNFAHDDSALRKMTGMELSDLQVITTSKTDSREFAKELEQMDEIRKTILTDVIVVKVEDEDIQCIVSDNFEDMELLELSKGIFPKYDDEIVITSVVGKLLDKKIGDSVEVTIDSKTREYTITGFSQSTNNGGLMGIIHEEGVKRLRPNYMMPQIEVYLNKGVDTKDMISKLERIYKVADEDNQIEDTSLQSKYSNTIKKAEEKIARLLSDYGVSSASYAVMLDGEIIIAGDSNDYKIKEITDLNGYLDGQLSSYASMLTSIVGIVVIVTLLVISGILFISIGAMLRKKKEEHGIYKALGYTTKELICQLTISFVVVGGIGVGLGSILTFCFTNRIWALFFEMVGISNMNLLISPFTIIGIAVLVLVYVFIIALLKAYDIRKVTPYELMTE